MNPKTKNSRSQKPPNVKNRHLIPLKPIPCQNVVNIKSSQLPAPIQENRKIRKNDKVKLRHGARKRFMEAISIAGLYEIYHAPNLVIRLTFLGVVIASICSIFYHSILLIDLFLKAKPDYQILQTDQKIIPFPKITVCAPSGINRSWAFEHLRFSPREQKMFDRFDQTKKNEFIEACMALMGGSLEYIIEKSFKMTSPHFSAYHILIESFKYFPNGRPATIQPGGMQSCEKTVSNCRLNGIDYDCCQNSKLIVDTDGPCFDVQVDKIDKSLDYPRLPNSATKLTFELRMDWNYILPYSNINGFFIHIGDPYTMMGKPIAVAAGSHAMIDVSQPLFRVDQSECFAEEMPDTIYGPYDGRALLCKMERYTREITYKYLGCMAATFSFVPNASIQCTGVTTLPSKVVMANGLDMTKAESGHKSMMYDIINSKRKCLPLCEAWEYTPRPSFTELMRDDYATPIGRDASENVTLSRVTVYLDSSFYMARTEQAPESFYITFAHITFVAQLYLGLSVVTFAEIIFYGLNLCFVYKKTKKSNKNKVKPENGA